MYLLIYSFSHSMKISFTGIWNVILFTSHSPFILLPQLVYQIIFSYDCILPTGILLYFILEIIIFFSGGQKYIYIVSTWNCFFLLFINYCIIFHWHNCKPTFAHPGILGFIKNLVNNDGKTMTNGTKWVQNSEDSIVLKYKLV